MRSKARIWSPRFIVKMFASICWSLETPIGRGDAIIGHVIYSNSGGGRFFARAASNHRYGPNNIVWSSDYPHADRAVAHQRREAVGRFVVDAIVNRE